MKKLTKSCYFFLNSLAHTDYSTLYIVGDSANWVLDYESRELQKIAECLKIKTFIATDKFISKQCIHYTSHFALLLPYVYQKNNRIAVDYFHGLPYKGGVFSDIYGALKSNHEKIHRVRVSHSQIEGIVLESGIGSSKVYRIPIGIDTELFSFKSTERQYLMRKMLGIPQEAVVIGSFQKDGNGWGEGFEPKRIKGPDIFLKALSILKERIKNIFVLLTGPARGFVKKGLADLGIPYTHHFIKKYSQISNYYDTIDLYLVTSREEGGPKAVLESMSSGVPLVTTRVGQAMDLVMHKKNAWITEVDDYEGIAEWAFYVLSHPSEVRDVLYHARKTAEMNSYISQIPLWKQYFEGFLQA